MENIKSTAIAAVFVFLIVIALSVAYYLNSELFGPGIVGDILAIVAYPFIILYSFLSLGAAILVCFDVLKSKRGLVGKILWILFAMFFGIFGAIAYYITVKGLGLSDKDVDKLDKMRPSVSMPVVGLVFIAGFALLLGGIFVAELGLVLLVLGTVLVLFALYLSKNITHANEVG